MKRLLFAVGLVFGAFALLGCARVLAEGEGDDAVVCLPDGTCLTAEELAARQDAEGEQEQVNDPEFVGEKREVDLSTQPWLVESVNLPANHPVFKREKIVWADSLLWAALPDVVPTVEVEKWLTDPPKDYAGKYLLIEVWATWCPPCRRSLNYLNYIAGKYKDDLAVVAICEMDEEAIRNMPGDHDMEHINYSLAVDTGRRFANAIHVTGIPHVILLEPMLGGVVWEGMPTLPGYELDGETLEKFFAIGRRLREQGRFPGEPQVTFTVSEPTEQQRATRRHHDGDSKDTLGIPSQEPEEKQAEVPCVDQAPEIDGAAEALWEKAAEVTDFSAPWSDVPCEPTSVKLMRDDENLYMFWTVVDSTPVFADSQEKLDVVNEDRVEFFFRTDDTDDYYYCAEVPPKGAALDYRAKFFRKFDYDWSLPGLIHAGQITDTGYTVEVAVPLSTLRSLGLVGEDQSVITGFFRADYTTGGDGPEVKQWIPWVDPDLDHAEFHIPRVYGRLILKK